MMARKLDYGRRTMLELRDELYGYIQQYYPEIITDFSDSSVGSLLVDLCAGVGDTLSFHTDRLFQETQLENAQQRKSVLAIARTLGLKIPAKKASVTACDFTIKVPTNGDSYSTDYLPVLKAGVQISGSGKTFETIEDIDFGSPYSSSGTPNITIIPQQNNIGQIVAYSITKREIVYNGITKLYKTTVTQNKPFLELIIPDSEVVSVSDVVILPGMNNNTPFINDSTQDNYRYYEVDSLADSTIFTESVNSSYNAQHIKAGDWKKVPRRFITEFTDKGFCKLIFGGGNADTNTLANYTDSVTYNQIQRYLDTDSLGQAVPANTTVFVYYRSGGGIASNIGANVLNTIQRAEMNFNGGGQTLSYDIAVETSVRNSLQANNPIPAFGGKEKLSTEEVRNLVAYNFSAQKRCVTLPDYLSRTLVMPGKFGAPFKATAFLDFNKVIISILGINSEGKLTNTSTNILADNITNYLSKFRMVNDYVEVRNGRIYNLGYDFEILVEDTAQVNDIISKTVLEVSKFHDINKAMMNEDLIIGKLVQNINRIQQVIDVTSYKVYNKRNGLYSSNTIEMPLVDQSTGLILAPDLIIYNSVDAMFEVKYPAKDVRVSIKKIKTKTNGF